MSLETQDKNKAKAEIIISTALSKNMSKTKIFMTVQIKSFGAKLLNIIFPMLELYWMCPFDL